MEDNQTKVLKHEKTRIGTLSTTKFLVFFSLLFVAFSVCTAAQAATLSFSPSSGSYAAGATFSVAVNAGSPDQALNAVSGAFAFPQDILEVASISKSGSIISLWVQEPSFSNASGTVSFEGIVLNPGFTGARGTVITVRFKAKAAGDAPLTFSFGAILANDGLGTNILSGMGSARFTISGIGARKDTTAGAPKAPSQVTSTGVPLAPKITSPTHPDPAKWYANSNPVFTWEVPAGTTAVRLLYDRKPTTQPTVLYRPPISKRELQGVGDGVWYFHVQLQNVKGWGPAAHVKFQIDTKPPKRFTLAFLEDKVVAGPEVEAFPILPAHARSIPRFINPSPHVFFETLDDDDVSTDDSSGIASYTVKVDGQPLLHVEPEAVAGGKSYTLTLQEPGTHTLVVTAFDRAENTTIASAEFAIVPLELPVISQYPEELFAGEVLKVKGSTYSNATVLVTLKSESGELEYQETAAREDGKFTLIWPTRLTKGLYTISAQARDSQGAESLPSPELTISVRERAVLRIGSLVVTYLSVLVTLIAVLVLLAAISVYSWYRFGLFRKKLKKEIKEAEEELHRDVDGLRRKIVQQVRTLESAQARRRITAAEKKAVRQLKTELDAMEARVGKEIGDIEEEVK